VTRVLLFLLLSASGVAHAEDGLPNTINKSDRVIGKLELGAGYHELMGTSAVTKNVGFGLGSTTGRKSVLP
jgi:hypothetical protein